MPRTRLLIGCYLGFVALLTLSGILLHHHGPGWSPDSVLAYYRGHAAPVDDPAAFGMDAPAAAPIAVAKTWGSLLEIAHVHLAMMPLTFLVLTHLFAMTPFGRNRWAGMAALAGFAAIAGDVLLPFAVRYAPAASLAWTAALLKPIAFITLAACLAGMTILSLVACLLVRAPSPEPPAPG
jgi:hypothetical protein